ncbi:MAG: XRE family transcriptional regulator [Clostridia bacterium]|nr:XRE family transcriptional regulator [Clostridia bacterium]
MELGAKIKELRLQCGLTQEELADRCDLTKGYISQLENELTSPSIATLVDMLSALGTNLSVFFSDEKEEQVVFTETDFFEKLTDEQKIVWLVPNSQKNEMEPILIEIRPNTKLSQDMPHEGEEFGFVLDGNIILHIGNKSYKVKKGEAFYFESRKVHFLENPTNKIAKIIWVSSPPTF